MADVLTIGSEQLAPLSSFFVNGAVVTGKYYALPPLGEPPEAGPPMTEEYRVSFPGRKNTGTVRSSAHLSLPIWVDFVLINTLASVGAAKKSFLAGLKVLDRYPITLPDGDSYSGCKLMQDPPRPARVNIASGYVALIYHSVCFEALSDD